MKIDIQFHISPQGKADTFVFPVYKGGAFTSIAKDVDKAENGFLTRALEQNKQFTGKAGQTVAVSVPESEKFGRVVLLGLGEAEKLDSETCETIGGKLFLALKALGAVKVAIYIDDETGKGEMSVVARGAAIATGLALRSYSFDKYKTRKNEDEEESGTIEWVHFMTEEAMDADKVFQPLKCAVEGVFWARDFVNEPPNALYPESFADMIRDELKPLGVEVEIFDERKMEKLGFHAHLAVGMGSIRYPRVVIMRWNGSSKDNESPMAFVGKGVTFDTGGINLKPSSGIADMKLDMGGAAAVAGLMKTLALRKSKANVVGVVGLAENMPSERAYRPSDVINSLSGQTIEVLNTDAEGRLVLADALTFVQQTYKPKFVIDLATLTGAMMVALGFEYCGTFVNDNDLWERMEAASNAGHEKLWRMPLDKAFTKEMDSQIADVKNLGAGRYAGACTAAAFLERFVDEGQVWAHMDIAGVAWIKSDTPTCPKPGTGFGVRVLDQLVRSYE